MGVTVISFYSNNNFGDKDLVMVIIRLARYGSKKRPFYKIVAIDSRKATRGMPLDYIGFFNPIAKNNVDRLKINNDMLVAWINKGAQLSDRVASLYRESKRTAVITQ